MQKLLCIICTVIAFTYATAQSDTIDNVIPKPEPRKSISISYGVGTAQQIISSYATAYGLLFTFGTVEVKETKFSGAFTFNTKLAVVGKWRFGAELAYETSQQTLKSVFSNTTVQSKVTYIAVMPRVDYYWVEQSNFKLYTGLGLGGLFVQTTDKDNGKKYNYFYPAFQLSGLGMEVGKTVCFFAEGGVGVSGSFQAGLRIKFQ